MEQLEPRLLLNADTLATAINVGTLSGTRMFNDAVSVSDINDYYRFNLAGRALFGLSLTGLSADADVDLLSAAGSVIAGSHNAGSSPEIIASTLEAGTYYARVFRYSGNTNYTLGLAAVSVPVTPPDGAGNSVAAARNLGTLSGTQTFNDWVGSADTNDYYRFSLAGQSNFSLTMGGLSNDADVSLLDVNGAVITSSANGGTSAEAINRTLGAGTYYVRAYRYSGDTNYTLALSATAVTPPDGAGNSVAAARNLGTLSGTQTFNDWVGSVDTDDYYRFSLAGQSNFSLTMSGLSNNADVSLLDVNGAVITSSTNGGTSAEAISRTLGAGTYYVRAYRFSGDTNYTLALSATAAAPPDGAGNSVAAARNLGTLSGTQTFNDWVGGVDTDDYYRFSLAGQSNFSLTMGGLSNDADVSLLDVNGAVIASSVNGGTSAEAINRTLGAGTYYVRAYRFSGDTNYTLALSATAAAQDWFSQNLHDAGIVTLTRTLDADGSLSRTDMMSIFREAGRDDGLVDSTELADMRTVVSNATRLGIPDYVRVLSSDVVNSNPANAHYQGGTLGNLSVGGTATQLEKLIDKWFLGTDHPATSYTYQTAAGALFQNGVSYTDVVQGNLGDCYFMASLASVAARNADAIRNMFIDNGDGTWTVRFFNGTTADYVTVDRSLPINSSGQWVYASTGHAASSTGNELWVALAEKAYAQIDEAGWIGQDNSNSYAGIAGGFINAALTQITARGAQLVSLTSGDRTAMVNDWNAGQYLCIDTSNHSYAVVGYNANQGTFTIYNPWGTSQEYTWTQVTSTFSRWAHAA
jgi:hypothetical protein